MDNASKKAKIYNLLADGFTQARVAKILGISRQYVNKVTKELLEGGFLVCINPKGNPKLYKATGRPYIIKQGKKQCSVNQIRRGRPFDALELCRVHQIVCKANIIKQPENVPWDNEWKNNGTSYFQMKVVLDIGIVTFRRIKGKQSDQLVIWMPERWLSKEEMQKYLPVLKGYAQRAANWFMKKYNCTLGLLELYQKPHFAFPEDPDIVHLAKTGNFSHGNIWVDESEGSPEWETDDVELAIVKMELPKRMISLEAKVKNIERSMVAFIERMEEILQFCAPLPPDEKREVV